METLSWSLIGSAAVIGLVHTALGPDHYLPFVMLGHARNWSRAWLVTVTAACGVAHVVSSLLLAGLGAWLGTAISNLAWIESRRGDLAAWLLIAFGLAYGAWGLRRAVRRSGGIEPHAHGVSVHLHTHGDRSHQHAHVQHDSARSPTFWALFAIFVLGPCEPLIPLVAVPASQGSWALAGLTASVFGVVTVGTMVGLTLAASVGLRRFAFHGLERWSDTIAGAVVALSGLAIIVLGV
jgi:nickel/cobalt exporter